MAANQLKQALWFMREILQSTTRGIAREELCSKWAVSSMNDYPGEEISERTFHRIRRLLEDVFQVTIKCSKDGYNRYRISEEDLTPGRPSLLDLLFIQSREEVDNTSSLSQIVTLLTSGKKLTVEDESALNGIASQLRRIPHEYGIRLITSAENGEIKGATNAEWDWDYDNYVMLWDDNTFQHTRQWLSVGFHHDCIYFYIVSDEEDYIKREDRARLVNAAEGVRYRRGYWWHEMKDPAKFCMPFNAMPDYDEIVMRAERILSDLSRVDF